MKVIEFPKAEDDTETLKEFFGDVIEQVDENNVTQAVVVMMNDDGEIGLAHCSTAVDLVTMLAVAFKSV